MSQLRQFSIFIKNKLPRIDQGNIAYSTIIFLTAVFPVIVSSIILFEIQELDTILANGGAKVLILFFLCSVFLMALAITPTTFIAILSGYFFGLIGLVGIIIAYPIAAFLGLGLGKLLFHFFAESPFFQNPKYQTFLAKLSQDQIRMLIFARLSPILPFAMTNMILGQVKLNPFKYLLGTMIGMLPRTLISFYGGMKAKEIWELIQNPSTGTSSQIITASLILISTIGLYFVFRRAWKNNETI